MLERAAKERATKILRMMETTNENERAAAATMLLKLAQAHKMNLAEFIEAFGERPQLQPEPEPQRDWHDSDCVLKAGPSAKRFRRMTGVSLLILLGLGLAVAALVQAHYIPPGLYTVSAVVPSEVVSGWQQPQPTPDSIWQHLSILCCNRLPQSETQTQPEAQPAINIVGTAPRHQPAHRIRHVHRVRRVESAQNEQERGWPVMSYQHPRDR
jgi:hypothetical protein